MGPQNTEKYLQNKLKIKEAESFVKSHLSSEFYSAAKSQDEVPDALMELAVLSEEIKSLASLHETHHQALLSLCHEKQQQFKLTTQEQVENQRVLTDCCNAPHL